MRSFELEAWFDSSPTDVLSPETDRVHTLAYVFPGGGDGHNLDRLTTRLHQICPELQGIIEQIDPRHAHHGLAKWYPDPDSGARSTQVRAYRNLFRRSILCLLKEFEIPVSAWTFHNEDIEEIFPRLCHSLGLKRSGFTDIPKPGRTTQIRHSALSAKYCQPLASTQFRFLMVAADCIATNIRTQAIWKNAQPRPSIHVVTDFISGDSWGNERRGYLFKALLDRALHTNVRVSYRMADALPPPLLLADNIAGMLAALYEGKRPQLVADWWREYVIPPPQGKPRMLSWNRVHPDFRARPISEPREKPEKNSPLGVA